MILRGYDSACVFNRIFSKHKPYKCLEILKRKNGFK